MAAAAEAMAVPPMPVKCTDLISDENMTGSLNNEDAKAQSFSHNEHFPLFKKLTLPHFRRTLAAWQRHAQCSTRFSAEIKFGK
jgi:hypothetical protein